MSIFKNAFSWVQELINVFRVTWKANLSEQRGQGALEYIAIAVLIVVVVAVAFRAFGSRLTSEISNALNSIFS